MHEPTRDLGGSSRDREEATGDKGITGKPPSDEWLVSILLTVMDKDTKTNVSSTMTTDATFPYLMKKGPCICHSDGWELR